jgi:opacity protein-like surface antigen
MGFRVPTPGTSTIHLHEEEEEMKTTCTVLLVLAIALIGVAPSVSLAESPMNYMILKGGIYSPSQTFDVSNINGGTIDHVDPKTGFNGEIAFGRYILPVLATELGVGYFESKGSPAALPGEATLKVVPVTLTAKGILPMGPIEPYGEFGIGAYIAKLSVTGDLEHFDSSSKSVFGLHAGAGVNFNITPNVFLGVEGRYIWAKPSFGGQDIKLDGFTMTADLGFRY